MNRLLEKVSKANVIQKEDRIVVGVSGGADSVCLLRILCEFRKKDGIYLCVVHVNHGIRGEEADRDEKFVQELCGKWKVDFQSVRVNVPELAKQQGLSEEEAGRMVRYQEFQKVCMQRQCNKIAVAHNLEDNAETILHHIFRGTGLDGLVGMSFENGRIIRPLLSVSRKEIEQYLDEINQEYQTDSTNLSTKYTRNKLRLELIPYIEKEISPQAVNHIVAMANRVKEVKDFLEEESEQAFLQVVRRENNQLIILEEPIRAYGSAVQKEIIRQAVFQQAGQRKDITAKHIESVLELFEKQVSKEIMLPYHLTAKREYEGIRIFSDRTDEKSHLAEESRQLKSQMILEQKVIEKEEFSQIDRKNIWNEEKAYTKWLDYDKIERTLILRHREPGDYIVINRQGGRKKLKDYFIDQKILAADRDKIYLLADGKKIVWVVGYRISEDCKITDETNRILQVGIKEVRNEYGR